MKMKFRKEKFFFNPESLRYESASKSIRRTIKWLASFIILSFVIAAMYYFVYTLFFDTYSEYSIKRENKILAEHLVYLNDRYEKLDEVIADISRRDTNIYSVIFESKPIDISSVNMSELSARFESLQSKNNSELILLAEDKLNILKNKIVKQSEFFDSLNNLITSKKDELEFIPSILPITNYNLNAIGASIGEKINPIHKSLHIHTGIDFAMPVGFNIIATASGIVKSVVNKQFSTGTEIIIDHGNDYETRYSYLDDALVSKGQKIVRGKVIGKVGNVGVTVPHLHYEVRKSGKIADPLNYFFMELSPSEVQIVTAASLDKGQSMD